MFHLFRGQAKAGKCQQAEGEEFGEYPAVVAIVRVHSNIVRILCFDFAPAFYCYVL